MALPSPSISPCLINKFLSNCGISFFFYLREGRKVVFSPFTALQAMDVHREVYTSQRPDGTVVTTTTRTKYEEDVEYGCGPGSVDKRYCCSPQGILRIVELIICLVVICLISSVFGPGPFKGILFGQTFVIIFTSIALCVSFIFLVGYFLNMHVTHLNFWPWKTSDFLFSAIAAIIFLVLCFLEAYYSTGAWANNCNDIGGDGVIHNGCRTIIEWAFAAFLLFVLAVLYGISAFLASKRARYD
uniref:MARVEL domain-containing protein n=1 Tax=Bursaphelenchus xylophilus TaxID=6326 RepID=A0A1I7RY02_BURXY